jgi:hypothetical protein
MQGEVVQPKGEGEGLPRPKTAVEGERRITSRLKRDRNKMKCRGDLASTPDMSLEGVELRPAGMVQAWVGQKCHKRDIIRLFYDVR